MSDSKKSLTPHSAFPAIPASSTGHRPDGACLACPLASTTGSHATCNTFKLTNPVTAQNRISGPELGHLQYALWRRAFDINSIVASQAFDSLYYYSNSGSQLNFSYFTSWKVVSAVGSTLVLDSLGSDTREILNSTWRKKDESGLYWINGSYDTTTPQALMMVSFEAPSKAQRKIAVITGVQSCTDTQITLTLDKAVDLCTSFYPVLDEFGEPLPEPDYPVAKIYHYGNQEAQFTKVRQGHLFYGRQVIKQVQSSELPEDGILVLETGLIATPKSFEGDLSPNFLVEGWDNLNEQWVTINENVPRLHISNSHGSSYAFKITLPEGSIRTAPVQDLSLIYTRFRISYWKETSINDGACRIVSYDRCDKSREDKSKSVGNMGVTQGVGVNGTVHNYCKDRRWHSYDDQDLHNRFAPYTGTDGINDTTIVSTHKPTGLANYPASGKCVQYGFCDRFTESVGLRGKDAPFNMDWTIAPVLSEILFSADIRRKRVSFPYGDTGPRGYIIERIGNPSIAYLNGYYGPQGLISEHGWHPKHEFRGEGTWGKPDTAEVDVNGNALMQHISGFEKGYKASDMDKSLAIIEAKRSNLPALASNYTTERDQLNPTATIESDMIELIGMVVERDEGTMSGREINHTSFAIGPQDIIAPALNLENYSRQERSQTAFHKESATAPGKFYILPLRQEEKSEVVIGNRTINLVTPLGGMRYQIDFENEPQSWSILNIGSEEDHYDSFDEIRTVKAGGATTVIRPYEHQQVDSYHSQTKQTGSRHAGASPGDMIRMPDGTAYIIESVEPCAGSAATTWGQETVSVDVEIGGYYFAIVADDKMPIEILSVKNSSTLTEYLVLTDETKPDLDANECWFDGNKSICFAAATAGINFAINWRDVDEVEHTDYFTAAATYTTTIDYLFSRWTDAATKQVLVNGTALTVVTADPEQGEVIVEADPDGKTTFTFSTDDAPALARMHLTFANDAPTPSDDWAFGGHYTSFGKKRDIAVIRCETDYFTTETLTGTSVEFVQSATAFVPQEALVVEWTEYLEDNWQVIPAESYTVNHGSGLIEIEAAWFDQFIPEGEAVPKGNICLKAKQVQLMDHRGNLPASLLNKIWRLIDSENMQWVVTTMGGGMGNYNIGYGHYVSMFGPRNIDPLNSCSDQTWDEEVSSDDRSFVVGGAFNHYYRGTHIGGGPETYIDIGIQTSSFDMPQILHNIPDGATIEQALLMVSCQGLTRIQTVSDIRYVSDCNPDGTVKVENNSPDPVITTAGLSFDVIAFTSPTEFESLGVTLGGAPEGGGIVIVDGTEIIKNMHAKRNNPAYSYGYGVIISPESFGSTEVPPMPEPEYFTIPECATSCPGRTIIYFPRTFTDNVEWGNISISGIALKLNYNGKDRLDLVQAKLPSMSNDESNLVPAP